MKYNDKKYIEAIKEVAEQIVAMAEEIPLKHVDKDFYPLRQAKADIEFYVTRAINNGLVINKS